MASLRDIFVPSAFRTHASDAVRDLELGGGGAAAEVFEVTDLAVPAGTDWSSLPWHIVHDFAPIPLPGGFLSMLLEMEDASDVSIGMQVVTEDDPQLVNSPFIEVPGDNGSFWGATTELVTAVGFISPGNPIPEPKVAQLSVALYTTGPTSADNRIVRARAAFLSI